MTLRPDHHDEFKRKFRDGELFPGVVAGMLRCWGFDAVAPESELAEHYEERRACRDAGDVHVSGRLIVEVKSTPARFVDATKDWPFDYGAFITSEADFKRERLHPVVGWVICGQRAFPRLEPQHGDDWPMFYVSMEDAERFYVKDVDDRTMGCKQRKITAPVECFRPRSDLARELERQL